MNVIFIKQQNKTPQTTIKSGKQFELSTVPFPTSMKDVFMTKRLDYWMAGRFRFNKKLFENKSKDLKGETFQAVVLIHTPAVLAETHESTNDTIYSGIEVEILKMLANVMNFSVNFYETNDSLTEKWGMKDENGTFSGLLGEMVNIWVLIIIF